jgi:DNA-directed RNA polymerase omega subunit
MVYSPQGQESQAELAGQGLLDSKFRLVLVAANRAEQLMRGARPKVDLASRKPTVIAMREVEKNLIDWGYGQATPEPAAAEPESEPASA